MSPNHREFDIGRLTSDQSTIGERVAKRRRKEFDTGRPASDPISDQSTIGERVAKRRRKKADTGQSSSESIDLNKMEEDQIQGVQEIKNFKEAVEKASSMQREVQPLIDQQNLNKYVVYSQLCNQFRHFQDCITQSNEYLTSDDSSILELPQKHQTLVESQKQLEPLYQELLSNIMKTSELELGINAVRGKVASIEKMLTSYKEDVSWLEKAGHLTNFHTYLKAFQDCILEADEYLKSNQLSGKGLLGSLQEFTKKRDELYKALEIVHLKVLLTDAERKSDELNHNDFKQQSKKFGMEKYAQICLENIDTCIFDTKQYFQDNKINRSDTLENIIKSKNSIKELKKAQNIINFRKGLSNAEAIIKAYHDKIPREVIYEYEKVFYEYWSRIEELQTELKPTQSELEERLKARSEHVEKLVKGSYMCMRLKPGRLKDALKRGRMPSTFDELEIGKSHSTDAKLPQFRIDADTLFIGYPPELPAELRPLYAFLTRSKDGLHSYKKLRGYGGIIVRFKEKVTERSTITLDDSGYSTDSRISILCRPTPYRKPTINSFPSILARLEESDKYILDPLKCDSIEGFGRYAEAQMHGGLPIDDIEEVIITSPKYIDDELKSLLEDKKRGVAYRILEPDQYELNMNWVNPDLAVGGSIHPKEIKALGPQEIMHVVDTRAEHWDNKDTLAREKIDWLHLPTPDNHPLSIEDLRKGTDWVNERLTKGERVLIHCEHGIGRSVLLTCAVLVTQGMEASKALELVKEQRGQADPNLEQIARLQEFEAMYRAGKLSKGDK